MEISPSAPAVATPNPARPNSGYGPTREATLRVAVGLAGGLLLGALAGCSASDDDRAAASSALPGGSASGRNAVPSRSNAASEASQSARPGVAGAMQPPSEEGRALPIAGASGPAGDGEGPGASGAVVPDRDPSGPPPSPGGLDPILPQPQGDCPEFVTGTQTILGLSTEIVAGAPGAVQGPLLFTWHGTGGNGKQALLQLPRSVQQEIVSQGGIIVAPSDNGQVRDGQDVTFVLGVWYDGADLKFADQIVACAVQNHNIDPRRIYVTGCSAGGLMAGVMSLERSQYVAAVAPNSGGIAAPLFQLADPSRTPAVMSMYGGSSDTVIVNFSDTTRNLTNQLEPTGAFVVECNHGMGHCGAPASLHEKAWTFMKAHPFGTKPSPYVDGLPGDFPSFCEIE